MAPPSHPFSAAEICIAAIYTGAAFLLAAIAANIAAAETSVEKVAVTAAGFMALANLARTWLRQDVTRTHPVNAVLLLAAGWIGLEVATALI